MPILPFDVVWETRRPLFLNGISVFLYGDYSIFLSGFRLFGFGLDYFNLEAGVGIGAKTVDVDNFFLGLVLVFLFYSLAEIVFEFRPSVD